jgi:hypothetical protein
MTTPKDPQDGGNTNDVSMTIEKAKELVAKGNPPFVNDRFHYMRCVGFLEGYEAKEKEITDNTKVNTEALERIKRIEAALKRITAVTQFDHPTSQIIGSEEYEGAWLDCVEIAKEALDGK